MIALKLRLSYIMLEIKGGIFETFETFETFEIFETFETFETLEDGLALFHLKRETSALEKN